MKRHNVFKSPIIFPVIFFIFSIIIGAFVLYFSENKNVAPLSFTDAVFTATSAVCVTGLSVVDTGSYFTLLGKSTILILIQMGGLGIMTFTSLSIFIWRKKTTITDRIAVGQVLLHDNSFNLGRFLIEIVSWTFIIETIGAVMLYFMDPYGFHPYSAAFHSISAFCNAGFSLFSNSLIGWKGDLGINIVFMMLIITGGIGFSVFVEVKNFLLQKHLSRRHSFVRKISGYSHIVLTTTFFLIISGGVSLYWTEFIGYKRMMILDDAILTSMFQSVSARTAGFNTLDIGSLTNSSLVILILLMFIGGAPGSCAGGIKVTSFRVLVAVIWSQFRGKEQAVIGKFAISEAAVKKAMVLFLLSIIILFTSVLFLDFLEGGNKPHNEVKGQFLDLLFEAVSAFCTVGLSTGITSALTTPGKWIIIFLMFIGRLGPFLLISALQSIQEIQLYRLPEENIMIG